MPAARAVEPVAHPCPNCGAPAPGDFCARCGQDNRRRRLSAVEAGRAFMHAHLDSSRI